MYHRNESVQIVKTTSIHCVPDIIILVLVFLEECKIDLINNGSVRMKVSVDECYF